jgi:hypothetical protein
MGRPVVYFAGRGDPQEGVDVADDSTPRDSTEAVPRKVTETGATAIDITGGVLGLVVFIVGVALVIATYHQAAGWYREIGPAVEAARIGSVDSAPPPAGDAEANGAVTARPGGPSLASVGVEFGLRLVWLLVLAFLGFVVAAMGARLAGAHRGKRT